MANAIHASRLSQGHARYDGASKKSGAVKALLHSDTPVVLARITTHRGSVPRESGTWMLITALKTARTIGGGMLEYTVIDEARRMLVRGLSEHQLDIPLGRKIGQCCGGAVSVKLSTLDSTRRAALWQERAAQLAHLPAVLIFGAGHVGRAMALQMAALPVQARLIDSRAAELEEARPGIETCLTPLPEAEVKRAPPGTAYIILTHDHATDFLIAQAALERNDAAYVGMIGSLTKRRAFAQWLGRDARQLHCPLAPSAPRDKRPEMIALYTAAELMKILGQPAATEVFHE